MNIREKALEFATRKHQGQKRKNSGLDYITHPIAVAEIAMAIFKRDYGNSYTEEALNEHLDEIYVIALLHDVLEDTDTTFDEILELFGKTIAFSVKALSKKERENYYDFITRLINERDFILEIIKRADITHNSSDLKEGSMKDKYRFALHLLEN